MERPDWQCLRSRLPKTRTPKRPRPTGESISKLLSNRQLRTPDRYMPVRGVFMKNAVLVLLLLALFSCGPKEEIRPPEVVLPPAPLELPPIAKPLPPPVIVPAPVIRYKEQIHCEDNTRNVFNSCGIDVMPFLRPLFFDMDNDGKQEMIAGAKDGSLRLYRNTGTAGAPQWEFVPRYFDNIRAGAFAAPAAADLDHDGRPEVLVGTGGFSSESGAVIIYRNAGTAERPIWSRVEHAALRVGNDAAPVLYDIDADGKPDLIVGNSVGELTLFRNSSDSRGIRFEKDRQFFRGLKLGMYVVPSVVADENRIILIAGNSDGKLYLIEKGLRDKTGWQTRRMKMSLPNFAAPAFIASDDPSKKDLVVSDGDGQLYYFKNRKKNYQEWEEVTDYFSGRVLGGPACAPALSEQDGRRFLVTGNINGVMKFFQYDALASKIPWKENRDYFSGIRLHGYAKGVMTSWQGKDLLLAGQQDGLLRAFISSGSREKPKWRELQSFFSGVPKMLHPAPAVYDIDHDGRWELILGDVDGRVRGFRYTLNPSGMPQWTELPEMFRNVTVGRFASPAVFDHGGRLYLLAGQQNGRIQVFVAERKESGLPVFVSHEDLVGITLDEHSSPSVLARDGMIELSIGNYNGGLRYFACRKEKVAIRGQ
ncbi:MAG: hypothetical protein C0402_04180 [Thermodesulfovibrio sp.]|nr:hypothetical protein [Thermodesulfovibrio sp.]